MSAESAAEIVGLDATDLLDVEMAEHRRVFDATSALIREPFFAALSILEAGVRSGGKVILFGNGGSAADAQHLAAELLIRYQRDRPSIAAIALTADSCALTACSNDFGFESVFERQIEGLGRPQDVALGISTSGSSANVLRGLRMARSLGMRTVGFTGAMGGEMAALCDALVAVPSTTTARVQEMHITIGHILCKSLEQRLGLV